jgi:hypothetical protein
MDQKYIFHVGDEVITKHGRVGKITSICTCERCEERGFYEPTVDFGDGYYNYITHWDEEDEFSHYYKIGDYVFGNLDLESQQELISTLERRLAKAYVRRDIILKLLTEE